LIYYSIKFFTWVYMVYRGLNKSSFNTRMNEKQQKKKEGEVNIDYAPKNKKIISKDNGDYVDFEDLDK
ncbi:MAG: DUF4834 family protein, partial [Bacteroidales bacterium]|nr:DUF4834 family protein [Bacteroidales bacterium]